MRSELRVGPPALCPALTLPVEVAAVQQVAVRGPNIAVERRVIGQVWEADRSLVDEQLKPRPPPTVVQNQEKVGGVRDDPAGPETPSCGETTRYESDDITSC